MDNLIDWLEKGIALISGGVIFKLGDFLVKKKKADTDGFQILKNAWREEFEKYEEKIDKLNVSIAKLENKVEKLEEENKKLRSVIKSLRQFYPDLPIPLWLKDHNGRMLSLNKAYEEHFLHPLGKSKEDCIGETEDVIWGSEIAKKFKKNDSIAASQENSNFIFEESLHPLLSKWNFYKYPKFVDGVFIGVGGVALPKKDKNITIKK